MTPRPGAGARLRDCRSRAHLSQAELAGLAGVSRQLVAAVEAGHNVPSVEAALRLAAALRTTVEDLFAPAPSAGPPTPALGAELPDGVPLRLGRVGSRLVAAPLPDHGAGATGWATADGILRDGHLQRYPGSDDEGLVLAGCDPALGLVESLLATAGPARLHALSGPTGAVIEALGRGTVHAAAIHGPLGRLPTPPVDVVRVHLARWRVGLGLDPALAAPTLESVLEQGIPIVQRDQAATSQRALERSVRRLGHPMPAGPRGSGHLDCARRAAATSQAALTTEPVARAFGLRFIALEPHAVQIWIDRRWAEHPGVAALGDLLTSAAFAARIAGYGGYDLAGCGDVIAAD